jgi:flagellar hook-length control protein FliK
MMVNAVAALTGAAYEPADIASTANGEHDDFASVLDSQQALQTPSALPPESAAAADAQRPADAMLTTEEEQTDSDKTEPESVDSAALWLTPQTTLTSAGLSDAILAPQMALLAGGEKTISDNGDGANALPDAAVGNATRSSAVSDMLRMINSPQASQQPEKRAELTQQPGSTPALFATPEVSALQLEDTESDQALLPMENRAQTLPTAAVSAPAFSPASLATPIHATPPGASVVLPTAHAVLEPEVGSAAWQQALGQQLSSFTRNGIHHAELRLHPEELGPLQVNLRLDRDQVQLHFVTDQQPVRAALEAAMPHLRASLAETGIQMDQGSVGSDAPAWGSAADSTGDHASHGRQKNGSSPLEVVEDEVNPRITPLRSGISIFA